MPLRDNLISAQSSSPVHFIWNCWNFYGGNICFLSKKCPLEVWGVFFVEASQRQFNKHTEIQWSALYTERLKNFFWSPPNRKNVRCKVKGVLCGSLSWTFKVPRRAPGSLNLENWMTVRTEINRHDFRKWNERPHNGDDTAPNRVACQEPGWIERLNKNTQRRIITWTFLKP